MARTTLAVQSISRDGLEATFSAAPSDGVSFANDGRVLLEVYNGGGGSINVTVQTPNTVDGLAIADRVVAVGAGERYHIGLFDPDDYNQSDRTVYVDFSGVIDVVVAALKV